MVLAIPSLVTAPERNSGLTVRQLCRGLPPSPATDNGRPHSDRHNNILGIVVELRLSDRDHTGAEIDVARCNATASPTRMPHLTSNPKRAAWLAARKGGLTEPA